MHLVDGNIEFSLHLPVNIHCYWHNSKENLGRRRVEQIKHKRMQHIFCIIKHISHSINERNTSLIFQHTHTHAHTSLLT